MNDIHEVTKLHDDALIQRITLSVRNDRRLAARLLMEMAEVQERKLYRDLGFPSMFAFATRKLGMSEGEASLRMRAATLGRAFPLALEMLERCEVNLTTLSLLASVPKAKTLDLLRAARFKSKQEVQALIATSCPKPDTKDTVQRLPAARANARAQTAAPEPEAPLLQVVGARDGHASTNFDGALAAAAAEVVSPMQKQTELSSAPQAVQQTPQRQAASRQNAALPHSVWPSGEIVQLSAERHKISFTGSSRIRQLLREAQDLRRHRFPAGDLEPLFERALELLVAEEKKRRFADTEKPRAKTSEPPAQKHSRHIPNPVKREVWARDGGQCCFHSPDGRRCEERGWLQFHHKIPFEHGGPSTPENLQLACATHNALFAERDYGRDYIERRIESASLRSRARSQTG